MAGNQSIQFLRGTRNAIANSTEKLLPGQPLYNVDDNYLTIGGGGDANDQVNSIPIACRELKGYVTDLSDQINSVTDTTEQWSIRYEAGKGLQFNNNIYIDGSLCESAIATGKQAVAFGGRRFDKVTATTEQDYIDDPITAAYGEQSFAAGGSSVAYGNYSISMGKNCTAYQRGSIALGAGNIAGNPDRVDYPNENGFAVALGTTANAIGYGSVAIGNGVNANGRSSLAAGSGNTANANYSSVLGQYNIANNKHSLIIGKYGEERNTNIIFGIGYGDSSSRRCILDVDKRGNLVINQKGTTNNQTNLTEDNNNNNILVGDVCNAINSSCNIAVGKSNSFSESLCSAMFGMNNSIKTSIGKYTLISGYDNHSEHQCCVIGGTQNTSSASYQTIFGIKTSPVTDTLFCVGEYGVNGIEIKKRTLTSYLRDVVTENLNVNQNLTVNENFSTPIIASEFEDESRFIRLIGNPTLDGQLKLSNTYNSDAGVYLYDEIGGTGKIIGNGIQLGNNVVLTNQSSYIDRDGKYDLNLTSAVTIPTIYHDIEVVVRKDLYFYEFYYSEQTVQVSTVKDESITYTFSFNQDALDDINFETCEFILKLTYPYQESYYDETKKVGYAYIPTLGQIPTTIFSTLVEDSMGKRTNTDISINKITNYGITLSVKTTYFSSGYTTFPITVQLFYRNRVLAVAE